MMTGLKVITQARAQVYYRVHIPDRVYVFQGALYLNTVTPNRNVILP